MFRNFNNCLHNKSFDKSLPFNSFMFCRYFSFNSQTLKYANFLNTYYNLDPEVQYEFIRNLPKPKYIKWVPISNTKLDSISDVCKKYKISESKAIEYLSILNKNKN